MIDANFIISTINAAETATHELRDAARLPRKATSSDYITGSPTEAAAPLSLDLFDQAELIHYCLQGWSVITQEEQGDPLPQDETVNLSRYLREHALWIAEQPWADDLVSELRDHAHSAEGMLGLLPKRIPLPTPCECGEQRWGYPGEGEGGISVECLNGHVRTVHQAVGTAARVSIRGAQRVLGISRVTVRDALSSGKVENHGTEHRPIVDTHEIETYLTERLRTHSL